MGKIVKGVFGKPFRKMKLALGAIDDPTHYIGHMLQAKATKDGAYEWIKVETIRGCAALGHDEKSEDFKRLIQSFEINGTHLVTMFSFFTQMHENRVPTEEEEAEFSLMVPTKIEEINGSKTKKD